MKHIMWAKCSFFGALAKQLRKGIICLAMHVCLVLLSIRPSVRVEQRNSDRTGFRELSYSEFLLKFVTCSDSGYNCTKMSSSLHDDLSTHM